MRDDELTTREMPSPMEQYLQHQAYRPTITVRDDWSHLRRPPRWFWPVILLNVAGLALAVWAMLF